MAKSYLPMPRGCTWYCPDRNWPHDDSRDLIVHDGHILAKNSTGKSVKPRDAVKVTVIRITSNSTFGEYSIGSMVDGWVDDRLPCPVLPGDKFWLLPKDAKGRRSVSHFNDPWRARIETDGKCGTAYIFNSDGAEITVGNGYIAFMESQKAIDVVRERYERIVACVNACCGIPNEELAVMESGFIEKAIRFWNSEHDFSH